MKTLTEGYVKRDTNIAKGAAIILLLIHHLYMGVAPAPIDIFHEYLPLTVATLSKVCVAIFVVLSGYGLTVSMENGREKLGRFTLRHTFGLMRPYFLIYVLFVTLGIFFARVEFTPWAVYGTGLRGFGNACAEFFALRPLLGTPTYNQTWWYMEAALVLYLCFPLLYLGVKRVPYVVLPVTAVPLALYYFLGNNVWDTCREIYWFFPFAAGIFVAQRDLLGKFTALFRKKPWLCVSATGAAVLATALIRSQVGLAFDTFFAVAIILFLRCTLSVIPYLGAAFGYLGRHSGNIFMLHSFIYCYFTSQSFFVKLLYSPSLINEFLALPLLLVLSLVCSELIEFGKRLIGAGKKPASGAAREEWKKKLPHILP